MTKTKQEIVNTAKDVIAQLHNIDKTTIKDSDSFYKDLHLDSLDIYEFILQMEKIYNVYIKHTDMQIFEHSKTLDAFCDTFYNYLNPVVKVSNRAEIMEALKQYLNREYNIKNAKPSDNFFRDLHFDIANRGKLCNWAKETFGVTLSNIYFVNLDDFCDKVFYALQRIDAKLLFNQVEKQSRINTR